MAQVVTKSKEGYKVKLEGFEGPFDLLLALISKQKIDIHEIPIAQITTEYTGYLDRMRELDLEIASEFLLVAATLLDIKAANLLPQEEWEEEEEVSPCDAREILIARLLEYKQFKNVSADLASRLRVESKFYPREAELEEQFTHLLPDFLEGVTMPELAALCIRLLTQKPIAVMDAKHITPASISIDVFMTRLISELESRPRQTFRQLTKQCRTRIEIIAMFLAVLELFKRGRVGLTQPEPFGEIEVSLMAEEAAQ